MCYSNNEGSSSCSTTNGSKKSVSFEPTATMRLALHVNNYTDDEYDACFYSHDDYRFFKSDVKRSVRKFEKKMMINKSQQSNKFSCPRGIESFTREGSAKKTLNRRNAWIAVLSKQAEMKVTTPFESEKENNDDVQSVVESIIAAEYANISKDCSLHAYENRII